MTKTYKREKQDILFFNEDGELTFVLSWGMTRTKAHKFASQSAVMFGHDCHFEMNRQNFRAPAAGGEVERITAKPRGRMAAGR